MSKKVKKIMLKKEEIVHLGDVYMKTVEGGNASTYACSIASVALSYEITRDSSWWNCDTTEAPTKAPTAAPTPAPITTSVHQA